MRCIKYIFMLYVLYRGKCLGEEIREYMRIQLFLWLMLYLCTPAYNEAWQVVGYIGQNKILSRQLHLEEKKWT